jgi:hypothetical protein
VFEMRGGRIQRGTTYVDKVEALAAVGLSEEPTGDLAATNEQFWRKSSFGHTLEGQKPRDTPPGVPTIWPSERGSCFPAQP